MADWSYIFDQQGIVIEEGKKPYTGWVTDYNMYTFNEPMLLEALKKLCAEG